LEVSPDYQAACTFSGYSIVEVVPYACMQYHFFSKGPKNTIVMPIFQASCRNFCFWTTLRRHVLFSQPRLVFEKLGARNIAWFLVIEANFIPTKFFKVTPRKDTMAKPV